MSLHTRCPQRIASTSAHRTTWRRWGARCYASSTADGPEWFQQVRTELLSRKPSYYSEHLDPLHYRQLHITLGGFQPEPSQSDSEPALNPLSDILTRFNARMPSSTLLSDGTDPLHSPGEPWLRRMWTGGVVRLDPTQDFGSDPLFDLRKKVACLERIKDVRLQGVGTEAKIFLTVERCFSHDQKALGDARRRLENSVPAEQSQEDWRAVFLKEERNLVFLKSKTAAELEAFHAGQTLVPRYLNSPTDPDYSHSLTPTRSLLFRYSALTFNAHLLHLDPTYARDIEGHRNLLVHGPLTLTLMLQTLNKHILQARNGGKHETVVSLEYRNLAPLYCDERMRVCVKKKRGADTENVWDVWIEGPTGGMAVKAVARTVRREERAAPTKRAAEDVKGTELPNVKTVAQQAKDKLNAFERQGSGREQLSELSRAARRRLLKKEQQLSPQSEQRSAPARGLAYLYSMSSPLVLRAPKTAQAPRALSYLYAPSSALVFRKSVFSQRQRFKLRKQEEQSERSKNAARPLLKSSSVSASAQPTSAMEAGQNQGFTPYSRRWRQQWVGRALKYLYVGTHSPLLCPVEVPRQQASASSVRRTDVRVQQPCENSTSSEEPIFANKGGRVMRFSPYSRGWRERRVGKALRYLYVGTQSSLLCPVEVPRRSDFVTKQPPSEAPTVLNPPTSSVTAAATPPSPPSTPPSLAQRQRAILLASTPTRSSRAEDSPADPSPSAPRDREFPRVRRVHGSTQKEELPVARTGEKKAGRFVIKKVTQVRVRKVDIGLSEAARKREHGRRAREESA